MAKKKKGSEKEFLYRLKPQYQRISEHIKWNECTWDAKEKIEKMYPNTYDFKLVKPPSPTPNMVQIEADKKEKGE